MARPRSLAATDRLWASHLAALLEAEERAQKILCGCKIMTPR